MAVETIVPGLTTVKIQIPSGSLLTLGYARNEPEVILRPYWHPVHSDEGGGDPGPPIDWQLLGADALIRLRLSRFDSAVLAELEAFIGSATAGTIPTPGSLVVGPGTNSFRLLLHSVTDPRNFPITTLISPIEWNHGTKYKEISLEFQAIKNSSNVLYNSTTS